MIELTVAGKKICFNLKSKETERGMFNYWYAVSDMRDYQDKKLKITTDKDQHFIYRISEIQNCLFVDATYDYPEDAVTEEKEPTKENRTIEDIFDKYFPGDTDISKELKKIFCKAFDDLAIEKVDKIFHFCADVRKSGYYVDHDDPVVVQIISELVRGPDDENIEKYVKRYIEYAKRKKFC